MKNENELKLKNIDNIFLKAIVDTSNSFPDVCIKLGFDPTIGHIKSNVERKIKRLEISTEHFDTVRRVRDSKKRYNKDQLLLLVDKFDTLKEILLEIDLLPVSSNYKRLRKAMRDFNIDDSKYNYIKSDHYEKENLISCISSSFSYKECLEKLGIRSAGGNYNYLKKYIKLYDIDISHFNSISHRNKKSGLKRKIPLIDILVENSTFSRTHLKTRLYEECILLPICCICGQDENWKGLKISLILDHENGVYNDNRIENLRIVCPNCNAGLDTFSGRNNKFKIKE